jgi:MFS family permease
MIMPAIPDLIRDFHMSYSMGSWFLTAYLIPGAVMTPIVGKLSDLYGKKRILLPRNYRIGDLENEKSKRNDK